MQSLPPLNEKKELLTQPQSRESLRQAGWWERRQRVARLGREQKAEREEAIHWFVMQGDGAIPALRRALHGPVTIACGAAVALERLGYAEGVEVVLSRCHLEEWHLLYWHDGGGESVAGLGWLGCESVGRALHSALNRACAARDRIACLGDLMIALSALRALAGSYPGGSPCGWWEDALLYGDRCLQGLRDETRLEVFHHMLYSIRMEGIRGLIREYRQESPMILIQALSSEDLSVCRTALIGVQLGRFQEALPVLEALAFASRSPLAVQARRAFEWIAGAEAAPLTLLRPTKPEILAEEMLRPALVRRVEDPLTLMRPGL